MLWSAVLGALPACANQCGADNKSTQSEPSATQESTPSSPLGEGGVPFATPKGISPNRRGPSVAPP